jgi:hypothetical protein
LTQAVSQAVAQQNVSAAHTVLQQALLEQPGAPLVTLQALVALGQLGGGVTGQSAGQVALVSPASHTPLGQSTGAEHSSAAPSTHTSSHAVAQQNESAAQTVSQQALLEHPGALLATLQALVAAGQPPGGAMGQSAGQDALVSPASHTPLGQSGAPPQSSAASLTQVASHEVAQQNASTAQTVSQQALLEHPGAPLTTLQALVAAGQPPGGAMGQSAGQVALVSPASHTPLGQSGAPPQRSAAPATHTLSHEVAQQNASAAHTVSQQALLEHPGALLATLQGLAAAGQPPGGVTGQSAGQDALVSPASHTPLGQSAGAPHSSAAAATHTSSHAVAQQKASAAHTVLQQALSEQPGVFPATVHGLLAAGQRSGPIPQSCGQLAAVSAPLHTPSPHPPTQGPQSCSQVAQDSEAAQVPLPQVSGQVPQSMGQDPHASWPLQLPSPHTAAQAPQSTGQDWQFSAPLHCPSPQPGGQAPQSPAQVLHVSAPLHLASPQLGGHKPQSAGQEEQVSVFSHWLFPHPAGQAPQSAAQVVQFSFPVHLASPQVGGHTPQSAGQPEQVSPALHLESPQTTGHAPQSAGQVSHFSAPLQFPSPHWAGQVPQSAGQLPHVSWPLQLLSPQAGGQAPQSLAQEVQVSAPLQAPSPQDGGQAPQSTAQELQSSSPLQSPSPHTGALALQAPVSTSQVVPAAQLPQTPPQPLGPHSLPSQFGVHTSGSPPSPPSASVMASLSPPSAPVVSQGPPVSAPASSRPSPTSLPPPKLSGFMVSPGSTCWASPNGSSGVASPAETVSVPPPPAEEVSSHEAKIAAQQQSRSTAE